MLRVVFTHKLCIPTIASLYVTLNLYYTHVRTFFLAALLLHLGPQMLQELVVGQ